MTWFDLICKSKERRIESPFNVKMISGVRTILMCQECEWAQVRISLIFHTKMHFVQSLTFLELWQNISTTNPSALMDTGFLWGFSCGSNLSHISKFATNLRLNLSWIGGRIFLPLSIKLSLSWECNFFNLTSNLQICQDPDILIGRNCEAKSQIQFSYLACPPQQM